MFSGHVVGPLCAQGGSSVRGSGEDGALFWPIERLQLAALLGMDEAGASCAWSQLHTVRVGIILDLHFGRFLEPRIFRDTGTVAAY